MQESFAVIFDMDGVLVDNNPIHIKAWEVYAERLSFELTPEKFRDQIYGRTNSDAFKRLYRDDLSVEEYRQLS